MKSPNDHIYTVWKHVGETPLQALERSREERKLPPYVKMAYAGRLDPMAEGKLLVLTGGYCSDIKKYWNLDKTYEVAILLGLASDSHDVLGRLTYAKGSAKVASKENVQRALRKMKGPYSWEYPVISSKPVSGKPLFQWFLEGRLDEIDIPKSRGTIYSVSLKNMELVSADRIKRRTLEKIHSLAIVTDESKRLGRDFRRHEVLDSWHTWSQTNPEPLQVLTIECTASAGTYMRTLADKLGSELGSAGLALEIKRTHIGKYVPLGLLGGFWLKQY